MSFIAAPRTSSHPVCSPHQEVSPFPARPGPVLWRLLTPPDPSNAIADAVVHNLWTDPEASQGKPRLFPAVPAGFTPAASGQLSGVTAMGRLTPRSLALYPIPVRRGRVSPPASFRFRLATDTLALGYTVRCHLRPLETLTPDTGHAWHTRKRARTVRPGPSPHLPSSPETRSDYTILPLVDLELCAHGSHGYRAILCCAHSEGDNITLVVAVTIHRSVEGIRINPRIRPSPIEAAGQTPPCLHPSGNPVLGCPIPLLPHLHELTTVPSLEASRPPPLILIVASRSSRLSRYTSVRRVSPAPLLTLPS